MARDIDAVIAALKVALQEAERSDDVFWKVKASNRWIDQLPGAWLGRWRHLRLAAEYSDGQSGRDEFIGHVRATLAYLETNREAIRGMRAWSWPLRPGQTGRPADPIEAEFSEVTPPDQKQLPKPRKGVRVVK
ncbi:MAG: hypothetical protein AB1749_13360 [Pseudomonadota bacterium]